MKVNLICNYWNQSLLPTFIRIKWEDSKEKSGLLYPKFQKEHYSCKNWCKLTALELDL